MGREASTIRSKRAVTSCVAILRSYDGALLLSKKVDHLQHGRNNFTSILRDYPTQFQNLTDTPKRPPSSTKSAGKKSFWQSIRRRTSFSVMVERSKDLHLAPAVTNNSVCSLKRSIKNKLKNNFVFEQILYITYSYEEFQPI